MAAGQAKVDAIKRSEELAAQLEKEQQKAQAQTNAAISQVKEVATTATTKIGEVSTEVGTVKTDVAQTKSDLEKTIANLKRVTGDLSSQGSLIATNSTELNGAETTRRTELLRIPHRQIEATATGGRHQRAVEEGRCEEEPVHDRAHR